MQNDLLVKRIDESVAAIRRQVDLQPDVAVILGTGLGGLAQVVQPTVVTSYAEIPHFPQSTAIGHQGQLIGGTLEGAEVVALNGRFHLYEGYSAAQITFPLHVLRHLGVQLLIVGNASGGINPSYRSGDIVLIDNHIDLTWQRYTSGGSDCPFWDRRGRAGCSPYDAALIERSLGVARKMDFVAHRGVYVGVTGPNYETRAEYRLFRIIGGDVVGMSTVPEVTVAAQLGMRVLGISTVTNVATPDVLSETSADQVIAAAEAAAPNVLRIVTQIIADESQ